MHVLIAGCGWLGQAVALACLHRGDRVTGIRRDRAATADLATLGIEPLRLDLSDSASADRVPNDVDAIVACQAAGTDRVDSYRRTYVDANRTLLAACRHLSLQAFVYTGSTGVFGQRDGCEVQETTPPAPASPSAEILVQAEREVLAAADRGVPSRVVRLSGLYGPGRFGVIDRVRNGVMALGPGDDVWTNWCHLDDAVQAVVAVLDRGESGCIYHASDAHPARRRDVVEHIAAHLGIQAPRLDDAPSRRATAPLANRRILSEQTRKTLGISLSYPSFRDGLASQFQSNAH
jgi:nucleoside-diphosphate-sugar epimerase